MVARLMVALTDPPSPLLLLLLPPPPPPPPVDCDLFVPKLRPVLRMILPDVMSLPKPSWWANAYPERNERRLRRADGVRRWSCDL